MKERKEIKRKKNRKDCMAKKNDTRKIKRRYEKEKKIERNAASHL